MKYQRRGEGSPGEGEEEGSKRVAQFGFPPRVARPYSSAVR